MKLEASKDWGCISDAELVNLILRGDHEAVSHLLLVRCGAGLKYIVSKKYQTLGVDFNELVSEVYIRLRHSSWAALKNYRGSNQKGRSCSLENYIYSIGSRIMWKKMDRCMKEMRGKETLKSQQGHIADGGMDEAVNRLDALLFVDTIADPVDRAVVMLYKVEERDVAEVAEMLGLSEGNVYTRCSRALKALRDLHGSGESNAK